MADARTESYLRQEGQLLYLANSDELCTICGYSLRGMHSNRCPECGSHIKLLVAPPEGRTFWWISATLGAGLSLLLSVRLALSTLQAPVVTLTQPDIQAMVNAGMAPSSGLGAWRPLIFMTLLTIASAAALAFTIARRRWFARASAPVRIVTGVFVLVSPLLILAAVRLYGLLP